MIKAVHAKRTKRPHQVKYPAKAWAPFCIKTGFKGLFNRGRGRGKGKSAKCPFPVAEQNTIDILKSKIENQVKGVSKWMIEAAFYIHFDLNGKLSSENETIICQEFRGNPGEKYFLKYFHQLQSSPPKGERGQLNANYAKIRKKYGIKSHGLQYVGNAAHYAAHLYYFREKGIKPA